MAEAHPCPARGCDRPVPSYKLACPDHWARVTRPTQQRVYQTWRARKNLRTIEAMRAHNRAMDAAIAEMDSTSGPGRAGQRTGEIRSDSATTPGPDSPPEGGEGNG